MERFKYIVCLFLSNTVSEVKLGLFQPGIEGMNLILKALRRSKVADDIGVMFCRMDQIAPHVVPLAQFSDLTDVPVTEGSPVNQRLCECLEAIEKVAKAQHALNSKPRFILVYFGDGRDSTVLKNLAIVRASGGDQKGEFSEERTEEALTVYFRKGHLAQAIAVGGGDDVEANLVAMGFGKLNIIPAGIDPRSVRRAFELASESASSGAIA